MTQSSPDTPSVVERTRHCQADAAIVAVHFLKDRAVFVLGEEALWMVRDDEARARRDPWRRHPGCRRRRRARHHRRR